MIIPAVADAIGAGLWALSPVWVPPFCELAS